MESIQLKNIIEGALLAAGRPLDVVHLEELFDENERPSRLEIGNALEEVAVDCVGRGFELKKVASGYRFQIREELSPWINQLWDEKPQKYSRALLETLALIAYRQPITRGDIEEIRGVSVSSQIIKTLLEREWIRVVGHRDVPGRPALYASTRQFLDYFNLASLEDLPPLSELRDIEDLDPEMELAIGGQLLANAENSNESDVAGNGEVEADADAQASTEDTAEQGAANGQEQLKPTQEASNLVTQDEVQQNEIQTGEPRPDSDV